MWNNDVRADRIELITIPEEPKYPAEYHVMVTAITPGDGEESASAIFFTDEEARQFAGHVALCGFFRNGDF